MFWKMSNSTATLKNKHFVRYEREREREIWIMGRVNNELQIINNSNNNKMNNNTRYSNTTEIFNINTDDNN